MRPQKYSNRKLATWLKWSFLSFGLLIMISLIYAIFLYNDLQSSKTKGFNETEQKVLKETDVSTVEEIVQFNGKNAYHVVFGKTDNAQHKIVFVPLNEDVDMTMIDQNDIVSKHAIQQQWKKQCSNCELIKIIPAMINNDALWEITYQDASGRYVLDYLSIHDGSQYEQYRFRRMFK